MLCCNKGELNNFIWLLFLARSLSFAEEQEEEGSESVQQTSIILYFCHRAAAKVLRFGFSLNWRRIVLQTVSSFNFLGNEFRPQQMLNWF